MSVAIDDSVRFTPDATTINVPVPSTGAVVFSLSIQGDPPAYSLVSPSGVVIAPSSLPANVTYNKTVTFTPGSAVNSGLSSLLSGQRNAASAEESNLYAQMLENLDEDQSAALRSIGVRSMVLPATTEETVQFRVVNGSTTLTGLDILIDGVVAITNLPSHVAGAPNQISNYGDLATGEHTIQVVKSGTTTPVLLEKVVTISAGKDNTFALIDTSGGLQGVLLADTNAVAPAGKAWLRVVNLAQHLPAVALERNGTKLTGDIVQGAASPYVLVNADDNSMKLRATDGNALDLDAVEEGRTFTIFFFEDPLIGEVGQVVLTTTDLYSTRSAQITYIINQIETGTWQLKVESDLVGKNFLLQVFGNIPAPNLQVVNAAIDGAGKLAVSWKVAAELTTTRISVYANPGAISQVDLANVELAQAALTSSNAETSNAPAAATIDKFTGTPLAQGLTSPLDGSLQSRSFDVSKLPSGTYNIWVEADDQNSGPVRLYAPAAVKINHPWPASWQATVRTVQEYRYLIIGWDAPSPDADHYRLSIGTDPNAPSQVIEKQDVTTATVGALEPGKDYTLVIEALDSETGRTLRSQTMTLRAMTAEFMLTAQSPSLTLIPNGSIDGSLVINSNATAYPDTIGLSVLSIPDGLSLIFANSVISPSGSSTAAPFVLQASEAVASGHYPIIVAAVGGGVSRQITLDVVVQRPGFSLAGTPTAVQLAANGSVQVTIQSAPINNGNQPIHLRIANPPAGLDWSFQKNNVQPGQNTILTLADSDLLAGGFYSLTVLGEDANNQVEMTLQLTVNKPSFVLNASTEKIVLYSGDSVTIPLQVVSLLGWNSPITLALESSTIPAGVTIGFTTDGVSAAATATKEAADVLQPSLTVTAPKLVYIVIRTTGSVADTAKYIQISAISADTEKSLSFQLEVQLRNVYLPVISR